MSPAINLESSYKTLETQTKEAMKQLNAVGDESLKVALDDAGSKLDDLCNEQCDYMLKLGRNPSRIDQMGALREAQDKHNGEMKAALIDIEMRLGSAVAGDEKKKKELEEKLNTIRNSILSDMSMIHNDQLKYVDAKFVEISDAIDRANSRALRGETDLIAGSDEKLGPARYVSRRAGSNLWEWAIRGPRATFINDNGDSMSGNPRDPDARREIVRAMRAKGFSRITVSFTQFMNQKANSSLDTNNSDTLRKAAMDMKMYGETGGLEFEKMGMKQYLSGKCSYHDVGNKPRYTSQEIKDAFEKGVILDEKLWKSMDTVSSHLMQVQVQGMQLFDYEKEWISTALDLKNTAEVLMGRTAKERVHLMAGDEKSVTKNKKPGFYSYKDGNVMHVVVVHDSSTREDLNLTDLISNYENGQVKETLEKVMSALDKKFPAKNMRTIELSVELEKLGSEIGKGDGKKFAEFIESQCKETPKKIQLPQEKVFEDQKPRSGPAKSG